MSSYSGEDNFKYSLFWILLAYFISFVGVVVGIHDNNPTYVYYGLFFFVVGLLLNISLKLSLLLSILTNSEIVYEPSDDE